MASAISLPAHAFFAPLQSLAAWLLDRPARNDAAGVPAPAVRAASVVRPAVRPLRVVRVFDGPRAAPCAGRMVISGRMADVCAELERLAAIEAAQR
ncbi:MAG: hypothetical protein HY854_22160 [Burkholderiales bacterium]|nr:hypothetical protein [Burkholderiales bacterium]